LLQWMTASRSDDMTRLRRRGIVFDTARGQIRVTWVLGTKGSQLPFTDFVALPPPQWTGLQPYLSRSRDDERVFHLDASAMTEIMRRLIGPQYSSHSIKKGALVHLIGRGHPTPPVAYKAKHRSTDLLRVYVGPEAWARAHNANEMAEDLRGLFTARPG
jgi:hypothetical protein